MGDEMILTHLFVWQIKITSQVSPHTMNMVSRIPGSVSLSICELDKESSTANSVVVANSWLSGSSPGKVHIFPTVFRNQFAALLCNVFGDRIHIDSDQPFQVSLLLRVKP